MKFPVPALDFPSTPFVMKDGKLEELRMEGWLMSDTELTEQELVQISLQRRMALEKSMVRSED